MLAGLFATILALAWAHHHHALAQLVGTAAGGAAFIGGAPSFGGPPHTFLFDTWRPDSGVAVVAGTAFNVTATTTTVQDISIAGSCSIGGVDCSIAFGGGGTASDPLTAAHWSSTSGTDTATVPFVGEQGATLDSRLAFNGGDSAHSAYISAYSAPFPTPTPTPPATTVAQYDAHVGVYKDAACTLPVVDLDPVGCWADQSGNGYNLTQATAAFRPIYHAAASPIGAPGILFDGVNDILVSAAFAGVNIGGAYVVGNYTGGATLASFDGMFSTSADPDTGIMFTGASGAANWYAGGGRFIGGGGVAFTQVDGVTTQSIAPLATWHVSVGDVNGNAPAPAGGGLQVGQDRTFGGARAWTGYIGAAGVYTTSPGALNDARINQVLRSIFIEAPSPGLAGLLYHIPSGVGAHRFDGAMVATSSLDAAGTITGASTVQGTRFISTIATGTAPATAASTTKVVNWNADLLDGLDSTVFYKSGDSPVFDVLTANSVQATVQLGITDHPRGLCNGAREGDINYDAGHFYGCNGVTWLQLDN